MRNRYAARMACAAVAGLGLVAAGLTGIPGAARAGAAALAGAVPGGTISTFAGGVGGPGPARSVAMLPCGLKTASAWLYIGTNDAMRRVNILTGALTTVAGNNTQGPMVNGGVATATPLPEGIGQPCGAAVDPNGNLTITLDQTVLVVAARTGTFYGQKMTARHIYRVAGDPDKSRIPPNGGPTGDGGPATKAFLGFTSDVTFDRTGNMLIADSGLGQLCADCNQAGALLRVVAARTGTFYGIAMKAGDIYSIAGQNVGPAPAGTGGPAARAYLGPQLSSAEVDRYGNIILAGAYEVSFDPITGPMMGDQYVQVIARATGMFYGQKMTAGRIYRVAGNGTNAGPYLNGVPGTKTSLWGAGGALADFAGNIVIGDGPEVTVVAGQPGRFYGQRMRVGYIYRIGGSPSGGYSGDGGPALRAALSAGPVGLDGSGGVLLIDGNQVRVIAARTGRFYGQQMTAGDIYTVAGNADALQSGDGGPPLAAELPAPAGIGVSTRGDIAFATIDNSTLQVIPARSGTLFGRKMTAGTLYIVTVHGGTLDVGGDAPLAFDGEGNIVVALGTAFSSHVWAVAATTGTFYGQKMTAGRTYRIAGAGGNGFSGDGGLALKAKLNEPDSTAVDHHGNVVIDDNGNDRLRVVAARTGTFYGIKMTVGDIYTVAGDGSSVYSGDGGPARKAGMSPDAIAVDAAGNLILTDQSQQRIRVVAAATGTFYGQAMTAGDIYTIAGNGTRGFAGNGGPATSAEFKAVNAVAVDRHGNVIFADHWDHVVWAVAAHTGTFYGQAMTVGHIYVVAGGGTRILGDGGPATKAQFGLESPESVAVSATGSLLITDFENGRIRAVSP